MRVHWKRTGAVAGCFALLAIVLTVAMLLTPSSSPVAAQDVATPAASPTTKHGAANLYQDFLTKLAANLGINDPAKVNTAIKTTLTQMVDEQAAAGHLKQQAATALKQRINKGAFEKVFTAFLRSMERRGHGEGQAKTTPIPTAPSAVGTPLV